MTQNDAVCFATVVGELPAATRDRIFETDSWKEFERKYRAGLATIDWRVLEHELEDEDDA